MPFGELGEFEAYIIGKALVVSKAMRALSETLQKLSKALDPIDEEALTVCGREKLADMLKGMEMSGMLNEGGQMLLDFAGLVRKGAGND